MKKVFSSDELIGIKESWLNSSITSGPNDFQLMMSLFDGKEVFFELDEVAKAFVVVKGLELTGGSYGEPSYGSWLIKGTAKPKNSKGETFSFTMNYNSHRRSGNLENGKGFIEIENLW